LSHSNPSPRTAVLAVDDEESVADMDADSVDFLMSKPSTNAAALAAADTQVIAELRQTLAQREQQVNALCCESFDTSHLNICV